MIQEELELNRDIGHVTHDKRNELNHLLNPLRTNSDLSQTSHYNIKGLLVREVMRIENMITQVKFS